MRTFLSSSALALLLSLGVAFGAQAGQADKAADQRQAGASSQAGDLASLAPRELLGKPVVSAKGKQLGKVGEVLEGDGGARYVLIDLPGDSTPPAKNLVPLEELQMKGGQLTWTSDRAEGDLKDAGKIDRSKYKSLAAVMGQDELRSSLQKAGFQGVAVVDAAYLVRAKASDGSPVFMMIDPPSAGAAAGTSQQPDPSAKQASASAQDKLRSALKEAGFRDVAVVDAAYLVRAKTADGAPVTMMFDAAAPSSQKSASR